MSVAFERIWAMPSRWTFTIKPIKQLLDRYVGSGMMINGLWCDPFAGENSPAQETNDLNPARPTKFHMPAIDFLKTYPDNHFDGVLFDPPYSPRQVKECYDSIGLALSQADTQQTFWAACKDEIARILKPDGIAISFGWNSQGVGASRGFDKLEILLVPHGGNKNDTIVTVETKKRSSQRLATTKKPPQSKGERL